MQPRTERKSDQRPLSDQAATQARKPSTPDSGKITACRVCGTRTCPNNSTGTASLQACPHYGTNPYASLIGRADRAIKGTPDYAARYPTNEGATLMPGFVSVWKSNPLFPGRRGWSRAVAHLLPNGWNDARSPPTQGTTTFFLCGSPGFFFVQQVVIVSRLQKMLTQCQVFK